ncbi:MAG TPA: LuxR family transcriptional regulator [Dehalococcoidia bacterium]|nr:LuxR family transcriptional regulator [Dehalococcoidia bacterium]
MLLALSPKEMQVLSWLARGYTNKTIADVLSRGTKAVERQVSNIYAKMRLGEGKDARVGSALVYLKATGMLPRA